jgi:hypothetical protein
MKQNSSANRIRRLANCILMSQESLYDVLLVDQNATLDEIKLAFKRRALQVQTKVAARRPSMWSTRHLKPWPIQRPARSMTKDWLSSQLDILSAEAQIGKLPNVVSLRRSGAPGPRKLVGVMREQNLQPPQSRIKQSY